MEGPGQGQAEGVWNVGGRSIQEEWDIGMGGQTS